MIKNKKSKEVYLFLFFLLVPRSSIILLRFLPEKKRSKIVFSRGGFLDLLVLNTLWLLRTSRSKKPRVFLLFYTSAQKQKHFYPDLSLVPLRVFLFFLRSPRKCIKPGGKKSSISFPQIAFLRTKLRILSPAPSFSPPEKQLGKKNREKYLERNMWRDIRSRDRKCFRFFALSVCLSFFFLERYPEKMFFFWPKE